MAIEQRPPTRDRLSTPTAKRDEAPKPTPWRTEGLPGGDTPPPTPPPKMPWRRLLITLGILLLFNIVLSTLALGPQQIDPLAQVVADHGVASFSGKLTMTSLSGVQRWAPR